MTAPDTNTCTLCKGLIQYVDAPSLPQGIGAASWEGWFHVDPSKEHFGRVGWYGIDPDQLRRVEMGARPDGERRG